MRRYSACMTNVKVLAIAVTAAGILGMGGLLLFTDSVAEFPLDDLPFFSPPKAVVEPVSDGESAARKALASAFPGEIVFDSNRSGSFGIYAKKIDGPDQRTIIDTPSNEMFPDGSPDGKYVVYAQSESIEREGKSSIWIIKRDGTEPRKLASDGTFPSFSSDGTQVYFERGRKQIIAITIAQTGPDSGSVERELFPAGDKDFASLKFQVAKPRVSADGSRAYFTSDKDGRWNAYVADLNAKQTSRIQHGCEPTPFANNREAAWVYKKGTKAGSGFFRYDLATGKTELLHDGASPRGHDYFPSLVAGDAYLLYGACRDGEHSHETSNYQIFAKDLRSNTVARVTFDEFTNRWPRLLRDTDS